MACQDWKLMTRSESACWCSLYLPVRYRTVYWSISLKLGMLLWWNMESRMYATWDFWTEPSDRHKKWGMRGDCRRGMRESNTVMICDGSLTFLSETTQRKQSEVVHPKKRIQDSKDERRRWETLVAWCFAADPDHIQQSLEGVIWGGRNTHLLQHQCWCRLCFSWPPIWRTWEAAVMDCPWNLKLTLFVGKSCYRIAATMSVVAAAASCSDFLLCHSSLSDCCCTSLSNNSSCGPCQLGNPKEDAVVQQVSL
jgi:hypothetical protein